MKVREFWGVALVALCMILSACQGGPVPQSAPLASVGLSAPVPSAAPKAPECVLIDGRADASCTPGLANPLVTQLNIATTICKKGWTATVRPPSSYTDKIKTDQLKRYGMPLPLGLYEEDHIISLEIGGDPSDPRNLYPQPYAGKRGARVKDVEERSLNRAVCGGRMKLADARSQIVRDWTHS